MVVSITGLFGAPGASIRITSPSAGAKVSGLVDIRASISGSPETSYVILGVDNERPSSTNSSPYVFELDTRTLPDGPHRIFVEAYDRYGLVGSSKVITIYVNNGWSAPAPAVKEPPQRVATQPRPQAAPKVAVSPAKPAAPAAVAPAAAAPPAAPRGPLPEPMRIAAEPAPSTAAVPGLTFRTPRSTAAGPLADTPRAPVRPVNLVRGHTVVLDGRPVSFDVAPRIVNDRLQVGFRAMFESTGAVVSWDPANRTAHSVRDGLKVEVCIGERRARVNDREIQMALPAVIEQGRTMVPVRFVAAAAGAMVNWDSDTRIATLNTSPLTIAERAPAR
jgi:hypothetical protein